VDVPLVIRRRLTELGLEQRGLAAAARVTESYISQLLAGKKAPPSPHRTNIYAKMERFLKLPRGKLAMLADFQRKEELKRKAVDPPRPLHQSFRELILRKCAKQKHGRVRSIVAKEAFGELERLVTQKLLDVAKAVAREEG
jgi:transcriptional regulator with XRE-family HTH domain